MKKTDQIDKEIESLKKKLADIEDQTDYLENQSRRNNVRISGISEDVNESWSDTEEKVKSLINDNLDLDAKDMVIERAHRTGKRLPGKPRQVVAKFLNYKDRESMIHASKQLKGTGIYINEDLSTRVIQRRKAQQEKLIQAKTHV